MKAKINFKYTSFFSNNSKTLFIVLFLSLVLFRTNMAFAQITRYVSVTGDDLGGGNTCTEVSAPCRTINQAIEVSSSNDVIEIAAGAYTESLDINKSLSLLGAGEGITIIQAHAQRGMAANRTINIPGDLVVKISDVTIRHGNAVGVITPGGGIYNQGSKLTLTNVTIRDNDAEGSGGGMLNHPNSIDSLINVTFLDNSADGNGGGMATTMGNTTYLNEVAFINNSAANGGGLSTSIGSIIYMNYTSFNGNTSSSTGGGMRNFSDSIVVITNTVFEGNISNGAGGGLYNGGNTSPVIANVVFRNNESEAGPGGGLYNEESNVLLTNSIFYGNWAQAGGGMYNLESSATLTNVTFSGNHALGSGGGIASFVTDLNIRNSIFWNNEDANGKGTAQTSMANLSTSTTVFYSMIQGCNPEGAWNMVECDVDSGGNIPDADPMFLLTPEPENALSATANLRLQVGSPAIDAGDPDTDMTLFPFNSQARPVDLDGNARVVNGRIDIGAYELPGVTSVNMVEHKSGLITFLHNFPNPVRNSTIIRYGLSESSRVELSVHDVTGRKIKTLVSGQQASGEFDLNYEPGNLPDGAYLIRLQAGNQIQTGRMVIYR